MLKKKIFTGIFLVACMFALSACYRMPSEDDYCLVPTTNNPDITRESGPSLMPNMSY